MSRNGQKNQSPKPSSNNLVSISHALNLPPDVFAWVRKSLLESKPIALIMAENMLQKPAINAVREMLERELITEFAILSQLPGYRKEVVRMLLRSRERYWRMEKYEKDKFDPFFIQKAQLAEEKHSLLLIQMIQAMDTVASTGPQKTVSEELLAILKSGGRVVADVPSESLQKAMRSGIDMEDDPEDEDY